MECPACGRKQPAPGVVASDPDECVYCGVIFSKYQEVKARRPEPPPAPPAPDGPEPRPLLESTSAEAMAYRVDPHLRTVFALLLFWAQPLAGALHRVAQWSFSPYVTTSLLCFACGVYVGMLANRRGYSDVLTAGGAGFLAGALRMMVLFVVLPGTGFQRWKEALPPFGIYSAYAFIGGLFALVLRKFLGVRLK